MSEDTSVPEFGDEAASFQATGATFHIAIQPHPLRAELHTGVVEAGCTLADLGVGPDVLAWVDGERCEDAAFMPLAGQTVLLKATVHGGNGKQVLGVVALIALSVVTTGVATGAIGGLTGITAAASAAAVGIAGSLAINALIPPPSQNFDLGEGFRPFGSTSNSNRAIPFGAVPRLYGTHRIYPAYGALPYTEIEGEDQYLRMLFCLGYGPLTIDIASAKLGDTPLSQYAPIVEVREGAPGDLPLTTTYTRNVVETGLSDLFDLDTNPPAIRSSGANARRISLDFVAPDLFYQTGQNSHGIYAGFTIERGPSSSGPWTAVTSSSAGIGVSGDIDTAGGTNNFDSTFPLTFSGTTILTSTPAWYLFGRATRPFRLTIGFDTPSAGTYFVRVKRVGAYRSEDGGLEFVEPSTDGLSEFTWTVIRTIGSDIAQTLVPGFSYIGLRLKTSGQLNGGINNFSVVASARIPAWNGSSWVDAVSSNPAYIRRHILTGSANPRPLATTRMLDSDLIAWAAENAAAGREFNGIFDARVTVFDAVKLVDSCGRGSFQIRDALYTAVRDKPGLSAVQVFTPRNAPDFSASKVFSRQPHALKIKFKDRAADWVDSERIVYSDGYSETGGGGTVVATEFESLTLFGVTHEDHAWKDGRYYLAVALLRPESFVIGTAIDNLICQRGDVIGIALDSALIGIGAGRIKSIAGGSITLDETLTMPGGSQQVLIRRDTASIASATTSTTGTTATLSIGGGVPSGVKVGDLVSVGTPLNVLITNIEPGPDLSARITAVPYSSPAVHNAETGPIPPYDPGITFPAVEPPAPVIVSVKPRFVRTDTGARVPRVVIVYRVPSSSVPIAFAQAAFRDVDSPGFEALDQRPPSGVYSFEVPNPDTNYLVRIRLVSDKGVPSPYTEAPADFLVNTAGLLTTVTLGELVDTPDTHKDKFSTLVITVPPPVDLTRYRDALVQVRRVGRVGWHDLGLTDEFNQQFFVVRSNGQGWDIRALAISTFGIVADGGPMASITVSLNDGSLNNADDSLTPYVALNVPNLRIRGQLAAVNTFTGQDLRLQWDAPVTPPLGHRILDYRVRLRQAATPINTGALLYESREHLKRLDYTIEQNVLDSLSALGLSTPIRAIDVEVICRTDRGGRSATTATKPATNPAPVLPVTVTYKGLLNAIRVRFDRPTDGDYVNCIAYGSQTSGFVPAAANILYDGLDTKPIVLPDLLAGVWYIRIQLFDRFGGGTISAEVAVTVGGASVADTTNPLPPTNFLLSSYVEDPDQVTNVALVATWDGGSDDSGKLQYLLEVWPVLTPTNIRTRPVKHLGTGVAHREVFPGVVAGREYDARITAFDFSGNGSVVVMTASHVTVGDTIAPPNVTGFSATPKTGKIALKWRDPPRSAAKDFSRTEIHFGTTSTFTPDLADASTTRLYEGRGERFVDHDATLAVPRWYRTRTRDTAGNPTDSSGFSAAFGPFVPAADDLPKDPGAPSLPPAPTLSRSIVSAEQVTIAEMKVDFAGSTDPEGNPVTYRIQYWTDTGRRSKLTHEHEGAPGSTGQTVTIPNVTVGKTYSVRVMSYDSQDNRSGYGPTATLLISDDTTAPANITNFTANPKSGRFNLRWKLPADADLRYIEIHRGTTSTFTPDLADASTTRVYLGTGQQHTDDGVTVAGGPYWFKARSVDRASPANTLGFTVTIGPVSITTEEMVPDITPPPKPLNLQLTSTIEVPGEFPSDVTMRVRWDKSVDLEGNQVYYNLEMWPNSDATRIRQVAAIKDSGAAQTSHVFPGVGPGRAYTARVEAIDEAGNSLGFTTTVTHTTATDPALPAVPTSVTAVFNDAGDLRIEWVNPTSANFRDVEVSVYADSGFTTLLYQKFDATQRVHWTASDNVQASGGTGDASLFVRLRTRGTNAPQFSGFVSPSTQPVKARPANVTGLTHGWSGDTGAAPAALAISWTAANRASFYELTIDGVARDVFGTTYQYTFGENRKEHSGTADPVLSLSVVGMDGLGQASATAAAATATNAPPAAPSSVSITGFFSSVGISVVGALPADGTAYRFRLIQTSPSAADITWDASASALPRDISQSATYQVGVRIVDRFAQTSSEALSNTVTVESLTLADLRKNAIYSDSNASSEATLAVMSDGVLGSGGINYPLDAGWVEWVRMERELLDRYRTITLSMVPVSGTSTWYLRTSPDAVTWRYFAGSVLGSTITEMAGANDAAKKTAAQAAAINSTTLGNSGNSRADLPSMVEARFVELFVRNTAAATTVREFYARRLVQSDDLEADSVRALHIGANQIDATHVNGQTFTGLTIRTAVSGARVELSTVDGIRTINSVGTVTSQQRLDGSGYVGGSAGVAGALRWNSVGAMTVDDAITLASNGMLRTAAGSGARIFFDSGQLDVRNSANVPTARFLTDGSGHIGYNAATGGSLRWSALGALELVEDMALANNGSIYRGKTNYGDNTTPGWWIGATTGTARVHIGQGADDVGEWLKFNGTSMVVQGTIRTRNDTGKRLSVDRAGWLKFWDDGNDIAASFDITASDGSESYITGGLIHTGTAVGSATQQGRIGVRGYSWNNSAVWGIAGPGKGIAGQATTGVGVYGVNTTAGAGNGYSASVDFSTRCAGLFQATGGTNSVALAARGNYAAILQQDSNTVGGSLLLKANTALTTEPTHTAQCGTFCMRYPSSSIAEVWFQTAGGLHGTGNDWRKITFSSSIPPP